MCVYIYMCVCVCVCVCVCCTHKLRKKAYFYEEKLVSYIYG